MDLTANKEGQPAPTGLANDSTANNGSMLPNGAEASAEQLRDRDLLGIAVKIDLHGQAQAEAALLAAIDAKKITPSPWLRCVKCNGLTHRAHAVQMLVPLVCAACGHPAVSCHLRAEQADRKRRPVGDV